MNVVPMGCGTRRATRDSKSTASGAQRSHAPIGAADIHNLLPH